MSVLIEEYGSVWYDCKVNLKNKEDVNTITAMQKCCGFCDSVRAAQPDSLMLNL